MKRSASETGLSSLLPTPKQTLRTIIVCTPFLLKMSEIMPAAGPMSALATNGKAATNPAFEQKTKNS